MNNILDVIKDVLSKLRPLEVFRTGITRIK